MIEGSHNDIDFIVTDPKDMTYEDATLFIKECNRVGLDIKESNKTPGGLKLIFHRMGLAWKISKKTNQSLLYLNDKPIIKYMYDLWDNKLWINPDYNYESKQTQSIIKTILSKFPSSFIFIMADKILDRETLKEI